MMVLVPPLPFSPPPRFSRVPCPLQFARFLSFFSLCLLSVRVIQSASPPTASDSPPSVRWTPPADSSCGRQPMPSPGFQRPACLCVSDLCGWWHRCELPGNYRDFRGVMVIYLFCRRTKRVLITPIIDFEIYILTQSLIFLYRRTFG